MMYERGSEQKRINKGISEIRTGRPHIPSLEEIFSKKTDAITDRLARPLYIDILRWAELNSEFSQPILIGLSTEEFRRTALLSQLGYHPDPMDLNRIMDEVERGTRTKDHIAIERLNKVEVQPYKHTRFTHSLFTASNAIKIGENLRLDPKSIALFAVAALFHDVGHAPLSHVGNEVLSYYGSDDHEVRSAEIVHSLYGVDYANQLEKIISEGLGLGQILKVLDTWAYLKIDLSEAGIEKDLPDIPNIFGQHITIDQETGILKVDEVGEKAIIDLLEIRSDAYGLLYTHPNSLIVEAMHKKAIRRLIDRGKITIEEFMAEIDQNIYDLLLHDSMGDRLAGDLFGGFHIEPTLISNGVYYPVGIIDSEYFNGKNADEIDEFIQQELRDLGMDIDPNDIVVATPQAPNSKVIEVTRETTRERVKLKAEVSEYSKQQGKVLICFNRKIKTEVSKLIPKIEEKLKAGHSLNR